MTHFYKTGYIDSFYNFGLIRMFNIIHCQLRNEAINLKAHLFNDCVYDNTDGSYCNGQFEDNDRFLFICPNYNNLRLVLTTSSGISY